MRRWFNILHRQHHAERVLPVQNHWGSQKQTTHQDSVHYASFYCYTQPHQSSLLDSQHQQNADTQTQHETRHQQPSTAHKHTAERPGVDHSNVDKLRVGTTNNTRLYFATTNGRQLCASTQHSVGHFYYIQHNATDATPDDRPISSTAMLTDWALLVDDVFVHDFILHVG